MRNASNYLSRLVFFCLAVFLIFSMGCGTANSGSNKSTRNNDPNLVIPEVYDNSPQAWENLFRRVPGLEVRGRYPDLSLLIRGPRSLTQTNEPLFVLNGVPLGHSFVSLDKAISPGEVKSIRVLKGANAAIFGSRGANGVIVVETKDK